MSNSESVLVIILNWNGLNDTLECLNSVKKIDYPNYHILLIDNGSNNNEADIIESKYEDITVIKSLKNLGFAAGVNQGLKYGIRNKYDYFLTLNNDATVTNDFLSKLISAISDNKLYGIAGSKIYYDNSKKVWFSGGSIRQDMLFDNTRFRFANTYTEVDYVSGCCMLIRRDVIESVGFMNEAFGSYVEDVEYCIRTQLKNFKVVYVPQSEIYHKVSVSSGGEVNPFKL